jgi:hypothetical protein
LKEEKEALEWLLQLASQFGEEMTFPAVTQEDEIKIDFMIKYLKFKHENECQCVGNPDELNL